MEEVELHLPPDVAYVGLARLIVCAAARQAGMTEERVEDLRIAVSEGTANAMIAHRSAQDSDSVVLSFGPTRGGAFGVAIAGVGPDLAQPATHELGSGWSDHAGLGVTVIRGLADHVRFVGSGDHGIALAFEVALSDDAKPTPREHDDVE
jgi:anti-sigma regulatory factor (Ser/Thr protein kinase)